MSFRKYEEYKESGVEWLGEIPKGWTTRKLKFVARVQPSNVDKKSKKDEKDVLLCNYTDVYYNEEITADLPFMKATASDIQIRKFTLKSGYTIITKDSEDPNDIAVPAYVPQDLDGVVCGYHLALLRPENGTCGGYLKRVMDSQYARSVFATRANGITRYGLGTYAIDNFILPLPPLEEQKRISAFLDRETTKIDTLIDKHEQLITLLQEKRQAIISHAVTRGLNSNVKMKDSGIEWLGEVPVEWQVKKLKFVARVQPSNVDKKSKKNEKEVLLCNYTDVYYNGKITENLPLMKATASDVQIRKFTLKRGDTIITKDSEDPNDIAVPAYVPQDLEGVICGYHLALLRPGKGTCGEYLKRVMDSRYARSVFATRANGITRYGLATYAISNFIIPLPPLEEQKQIAVFLDKETTKIDTLIEQCKTAIALLRERRTALISAAVTGKMMCGVLSKGG